MQSLSRALTLLAELSKHDRPLTLGELSELVGLHKSTVHRMLATFIEHGLVRRDEAQRYLVGSHAFELTRAAQLQGAPTPAVTEALHVLHERVGETAYYAVPDGTQMIAVAEGTSTADATTHVGRHLELHSTASGKAYLAHRPDVEIEHYLTAAPFPPITPRTITGGSGLLRALASVRRNGFSVEDGESECDRRAVGAPVLDRQGHAVAAVSVALPSLVRSDDLRAVSVAVMTAAAQIQGDCSGVLHPRMERMRRRLAIGRQGA